MANDVRLVECKSHDLEEFRNINSALRGIYQCESEEMRNVYFRLGQYLIGYMLWPKGNQVDGYYDNITQRLMYKMSELYQMDVNEAMKDLNSKIKVRVRGKKKAETGTDIVDEFVNDDGFIRSLPSFDSNSRTIWYIIICIGVYAFIITAFWLCYGYSNWGKERVLYTFYVVTYCTYFTFFIMNVWLSWKQLKLYMKKKYGWLFRMYYLNNGYQDDVFYHDIIGNGEYEFYEIKFIQLYNVIVYQYMTSQCLKKLFEHDHQWMSDLILQYLFIEDIERLLYDIYEGNADKDDEVLHSDQSNMEQGLPYNADHNAKAPLNRYWFPYGAYEDLEMTFYGFIPEMNAKFVAFMRWKEGNPSIFELHNI